MHKSQRNPSKFLSPNIESSLAESMIISLINTILRGCLKIKQHYRLRWQLFERIILEIAISHAII